MSFISYCAFALQAFWIVSGGKQVFWNIPVKPWKMERGTPNLPSEWSSYPPSKGVFLGNEYSIAAVMNGSSAFRYLPNLQMTTVDRSLLLQICRISSILFVTPNHKTGCLEAGWGSKSVQMEVVKQDEERERTAGGETSNRWISVNRRNAEGMLDGEQINGCSELVSPAACYH